VQEVIEASVVKLDPAKSDKDFHMAVEETAEKIAVNIVRLERIETLIRELLAIFDKKKKPGQKEHPKIVELRKLLK
jgi:hypothetical protein